MPALLSRENVVAKIFPAKAIDLIALNGEKKKKKKRTVSFTWVTYNITRFGTEGAKSLLDASPLLRFRGRSTDRGSREFRASQGLNELSRAYIFIVGYYISTRQSGAMGRTRAAVIPRLLTIKRTTMDSC